MLDATAISETYDRFAKGETAATEVVRGWAAGIVHGGGWRFEDADAVLQDILLKLVRLAEANKVTEPGGFQKFVYTVAKRACVDQYYRERKRRDRERPTDDDQPEPAADWVDPGASLENEAQLEALRYVIQGLPGRCRDLWRWIYVDKLPGDEIAERWGITLNNVRVRTHRCLERAKELRERYERWGTSPGGAA